MFKKLITIANQLDELGYLKEATLVDEILKSFAQQSDLLSDSALNDLFDEEVDSIIEWMLREKLEGYEAKMSYDEVKGDLFQILKEQNPERFEGVEQPAEWDLESESSFINRAADAILAALELKLEKDISYFDRMNQSESIVVKYNNLKRFLKIFRDRYLADVMMTGTQWLGEDPEPHPVEQETKAMKAELYERLQEILSQVEEDVKEYGVRDWETEEYVPEDEEEFWRELAFEKEFEED